MSPTVLSAVTRAPARPASVRGPVEIECHPETRDDDAQRVRWRPETTAALRNVRIMHLLARVARAFEVERIDLMVLKGAALNLTVYETPDDRPMSDLDLLVRPGDVERVHAVLESLGCLRRPTPFREDFFPRFHDQIQYASGGVTPVTIDLHARPFRPLRYVRRVPDTAIWSDAERIEIGDTSVLIPSRETMLIHLAAHAAWHDRSEPKWDADIDRWLAVHRDAIDWERFLRCVGTWGLTAAVRTGLRLDGDTPASVPAATRTCLTSARPSWRERLALWHAPRDLRHLHRAALVNVLTMSGIRARLTYIANVLRPDRTYMASWCRQHQCDRSAFAPALRCLWPAVRRVPGLRGWLTRVEVRESPIHGLGVFATHAIRAGEVVARYEGRPIDRDGTYVSYHTTRAGGHARHEITGRLRYLNHSCRPNAELRDFRLVAMGPVRAGGELTIDYGDCTCERARDDEVCAHHGAVGARS